MAAASAAARRAVRSSGKKLVATTRSTRFMTMANTSFLVERQRALEKASRVRQVLGIYPWYTNPAPGW